MIRGFSIFAVCLVALVGLALAAKHPMDAIDSYQLASGQPVTLGAVMTSVIVFYFVCIGASLIEPPYHSSHFGFRPTRRNSSFYRSSIPRHRSR